MTYLLQVSTCWIVFYGIYMLFLQRETFFTINRYYLLGALFAGLAIPFLGSYLPANQTSTEIYQVMSQVATLEVTPQVEQSTAPFNWLNVLYIIYALGAIVVFSRFVYGLYKIYGYYKNSVKTKYEKYTLVESSKFHLPFSFFHFIFISKELPLNDDVEKVLRHEELHAHQWHSLDIVILELLQVFFWFNPVLIFYKAALKQSHEFLADAYVTKDHNRSSYGQLLLRQSTSGLEIALANHFFHSQIKKRITMLYKEKSKRPAMVKYLAAIPVLIGLVVLFASSKADDNSQNASVKDCIPIKIEGTNSYSSEGTSMTLAEIKAKFNDKSSPKCVDISFNNSTPIKSLEPIAEAASKANISIQITDEKSNELLSKNSDQALIQADKDSNFDGRKIIQRNHHYKESIKRPLKGKITINAEADQNGNITYAELSKEETTISDDELLKQVLRAAKMNKIEKGSGTAKGQFIYEFNLGKSLHNYIYDSQEEKFKPQNKNQQGDPIYKVVEEMPRFPGCEELNGSAKEKEECAKQKMLEYIYKNLTYPANARNNGVQGMCVLQFIIGKDGKITDGKTVRDIGAGCGDEALRVVNTMPNWIPGKQKGEAVRVQYTLPVKFKLESEDMSDEQKNFMANVTAFGKKSEKAKKKNLVIDSDQTDDNPSGSQIFKVVEEMPRFPGCENAEMTLSERDLCSKKKMLEFIYTNLKYPKEARKQGIDGIAIVQMTIEKDGSVTSSKIVRNPGAGTGTEAKRVVDLMPKWIPGKQGGKFVRVQYTLPIRYKLEGDDQPEKSKGNKIVNGSLKIEKEKFVALENLESIKVATGLSPECKIEKYRMVHASPKSTDATVSIGDAGPFSEFAKGQVQSAKVGDMFFFEEVHCQCPGDEASKNYGAFIVKIVSSKTNKVVSEVDKKPLFPNTTTEDESISKLLTFIGQKVTYPKDAAQNGIEGTTIIKFVINSKGKIQDVKLAKSLGWGIDDVVLELMDEMQEIETPWTPAILDNENVNYEYVLPIKFKLEDKQIAEAKSRVLKMQKVNISPNPSNGHFTLAFDTEDKSPADILFYTIDGKLLKSITDVNIPFSRSIDLSNYNGQTIFMNIIQNDKVYSDKIIVN